MNAIVRRNRLLPWYIGIGIILVAEVILAYQILYGGCPAPVLLGMAMLVVIPVIYLTLMYLTFVSQE
jgi:hypothetical protein